jgi:S1-C subfamily serine protease
MATLFEKVKALARKPKLKFLAAIIILAIGFTALGFSTRVFTGNFYPQILQDLSELKFEWPWLKPTATETPVSAYQPQTSQEQAVIKTVKEVSPAVVSIIITKDLPVYEQYYASPFDEFFGGQFFQFQIPQYRQKGTEKTEIGGGSGFIISADGMVLTNKHVVLDDQAEYTVLTNDGRKFAAKILAKDPIQDLAILKIEAEQTVSGGGGLLIKPFPVVKLGNSSTMEIGQTVIAIGNALGEFRNTVSVGVVSGLGRTITASGGVASSFVETLENVIQTDAAINEGNSGGPLLNLLGEVVGINTATVQQAQSIGFALPINIAKRDIQQIKTIGKIAYPFLGVRYMIVNDQVQKENKLPVNYGAWLTKGSAGEAAVTAGSVADKAGLKEGDIILEFNNEKITSDNSLAKILQKYNPADNITLKVRRGDKEMSFSLVLGERSE